MIDKEDRSISISNSVIANTIVQIKMSWGIDVNGNIVDIQKNKILEIKAHKILHVSKDRLMYIDINGRLKVLLIGISFSAPIYQPEYMVRDAIILKDWWNDEALIIDVEGNLHIVNGVKLLETHPYRCNAIGVYEYEDKLGYLDQDWNI